MFEVTIKIRDPDVIHLAEDLNRLTQPNWREAWVELLRRKFGRVPVSGTLVIGYTFQFDNSEEALLFKLKHG